MVTSTTRSRVGPNPTVDGASTRTAAIAFALLVVSMVASAARAESVLPTLVGRPARDSQLIGCDRASERLVIDRSSHLDPSCVYTGGVDIVASNVRFDCRGATIEDTAGNRFRGIDLHGAEEDLSRVQVRNCVVRGFSVNIHIRRRSWRLLEPGREYENGLSRIEVRNNRILDARIDGVYVGPYVTGVTLRELDIGDSHAVGIYLDAASRGSRVFDNHIHDNGFGDVDPEGIPFFFDGIEFRYLSTGREGLAIDGSRDNHIWRNHFERNSNGAVFLYKNCGEAGDRPGVSWERPHGADRNVIRHNSIVDERNGVWVGSRMSENQIFLDCSDPAYLEGPVQRVHEDFADDNVIRGNAFEGVRYGVRVEDDRTRILGNHFRSSDAEHRAIVIGTLHRTMRLGRPVTETRIKGNRAEIDGNATPYTWVHGIENTQFRDNRAHGRPASLVEGAPPPVDPFLFAREFWVAP